MDRTTSPKKRMPRKKVISSRWAIPPSEQKDGVVDESNLRSSKKTFRACRCKPASPNSDSRCQCMMKQGTMANSITFATPRQLTEGEFKATKPHPLNISATSSEATTNSSSYSTKKQLRKNGDSAKKSRTLPQHTSENAIEQSEPTLRSSRPSSALSKKHLLDKEKWLTSLMPAQTSKKMSIQKEDLTEERDDGESAEEQREIDDFRVKATLMKVCMDKCTKPIYDARGETYKGKYHDVDEIIAEWKKNPVKLNNDERVFDDQVAQGLETEPVLKKTIIRRKLPETMNNGNEFRNCKSGGTMDCQPQNGTLKTSNRANKDRQMQEVGYSAQTWEGDTRQKNVMIREPILASTQKPTRKSRDETDEYLEDEDEEEKWCEEKCLQLSGIIPVNEEEAQQMKAGRQSMTQEPVLSSDKRPIQGYTKEMEPERDWCDRTCEELVYEWAGIQPQTDPSFESKPARFAQLPGGETMDKDEQEVRLQRLLKLCKDACNEKETTVSGRAKKHPPDSLNNAFIDSFLPQLEKRRQRKKEKQRKAKEYENTKEKVRQQIVDICMQKCKPVLPESSSEKSLGAERTKRRAKDTIQPDTLSEPPQQGYLPHIRIDSKFCEDLKDVCEKLADDLVEMHYKYGPTEYDYNADPKGGMSEAEPETKVSREPKTPLGRNVSNTKLKGNAEPKYQSVKRGFNIYRTKISRGREGETDSSVQKLALEEGSSTSSIKVARRAVRPPSTREPFAKPPKREELKVNSNVSVGSEAASEDSRESFYKGLKDFEDTNNTKWTESAPMSRSRSPQIRERSNSPQMRNRSPSPQLRTRSQVTQTPHEGETHKLQPDYQDHTTYTQPHHQQNSTRKQPPDYYQTPIYNQHPDNQTTAHTQPLENQQTSKTKRQNENKTNNHQQNSTYAQQPDDDQAHTSQLTDGEPTSRYQPYYVHTSVQTELTHFPTSHGPSCTGGTVVKELSISSSRVMFADRPITSPTPLQPTTSGISITGSNESNIDCDSNNQGRRCLKYPVSSEKRLYSATMYLREEELSKLKRSASRSRSNSPVQNPINHPNLLRGMQRDEGYSLAHHAHRPPDDSEMSIARSQHSLTVCAQAEARQRLLNRRMTEVLGLQGITPLVVEKTIGRCTWGVRAYRL